MLDNNGLADLHRAGFATDRLQRPVELSVDVRVEHALRDELLKAKEKYKARAASGLVSNVKTGEIVAMVSLPDFDPNNPREAHDPDRINRLTTGVYEMGSTFKALTLAMALKIRQGQISAPCSMPAARCTTENSPFTIRTRWAGLSRCRKYSPSRRMSARRGSRWRRASRHTRRFCARWGSSIGCAPRRKRRRWCERSSKLNFPTIAFGHGLSVAPLQAVMGINAVMNGGYLIRRLSSSGPKRKPGRFP